MGRISKQLGASFITSIPKKSGTKGIKDFGHISLIGFIYKISEKVLPSRLQKVLPLIISHVQGAFVHGRRILVEALLPMNVSILSIDLSPGLICKLDLKKKQMLVCEYNVISQNPILNFICTPTMMPELSVIYKQSLWSQ